MTEYIVIVAMIAVAAIATYKYFGQAVRDQTAAIAQEVSGVNGDPTKVLSQTASAAAATAANKKEDLNTYTNNVGK